MPVLKGHVVDVAVAVDAGVVAEDVKAAEFFIDSFDHTDDVFFLADVGADDDGAAALAADVFGDLFGHFKRVLRGVVHGDVRPGFRQTARHCRAEPLRGAGDQSDLTC